MIQNILFDMGNVLMCFDPQRFIDRLGLDEADAKLLRWEVFDSTEWVELDRGTLNDEQALASMCRRIPARLHAAARELVERWDEPRIPMDEMCALVGELSQKGYGLYLLSNASLRHHIYWPRLPVARYFGERLMISSDWKLLKPDPAFYEKAFSLFQLNRSECLFIDDNPMNVEAALRLGLDGIVYHGEPALLRERMRERGVDV